MTFDPMLLRWEMRLGFAATRPNAQAKITNYIEDRIIRRYMDPFFLASIWAIYPEGST